LGAVFFFNEVLIRHTIFWEIRHFEKHERMEIRKKDRKTKGKGKEKRILDNFHFKEKLDTIEDHHNKNTIEDQCCSWATPLKKCVRAVFFYWGFHKASYILKN